MIMVICKKQRLTRGQYRQHCGQGMTDVSPKLYRPPSAHCTFLLSCGFLFPPHSQTNGQKSYSQHMVTLAGTDGSFAVVLAEALWESAGARRSQQTHSFRAWPLLPWPPSLPIQGSRRFPLRAERIRVCLRGWDSTVVNWASEEEPGCQNPLLVKATFA